MLRRLIVRHFDRLINHPLNTGGCFYGDNHFITAGATLAERWSDIERIAEFRPEDRVLDMGCAEGLITLELAMQVREVHGVDKDPNRIAFANREAAKRNIGNATFSVGSVIDSPIDPAGYDVALFLNVISGKSNVGTRELERLLAVTRRQIFVRANIQRYHQGFISLSDIMASMDRCGFDSVCFPGQRGRGNLIIGNRRGTDARVRVVPPLVLLPADRMQDHPCIKGAEIGSYRDFN